MNAEADVPRGEVPVRSHQIGEPALSSFSTVHSSSMPHRSRLRVLFLSGFVPYPPKGGCFQRNYNLIKRLGALNDVHLIALRHKGATHPREEMARSRDELLKHCLTVDVVDIADRTRRSRLMWQGVVGLLTGDPLSVALYRSDEVRQHIRRLIGQHKFDVAHLDTIGLAEYLPDVGSIPSIMTHHGAESFMIRRRIRHERNPLIKAFFIAEWLRLRRYERRKCPAVAMNVAMSELDQAILQGDAPGSRFCVVGNGVDVDVFTPGEPATAPAIIFAGRLDQYSNRVGILHFLRETWPLVREAHPTAVIHVIGMNPAQELSDIAARDEHVKLHGFVPDVRPYFRSATVAICPVRDGGGTRIKILDALAMGIPMVSTTIGAEGLAVTPEHDVLIADSPEQWASQIGRVFQDTQLRSRLSTNGRKMVVSRYSWDALAERLDAAYRALLAPSQLATDPCNRIA
jgi:glycosyltransferase involved in cell wall biosynthesis